MIRKVIVTWYKSRKFYDKIGIVKTMVQKKQQHELKESLAGIEPWVSVHKSNAITVTPLIQM